MKIKLAILAILAVALVGCGKMGVAGHINQAFGNWAQITVPKDCVPKEIASSSDAGVALLCEDGRLFH